MKSRKISFERLEARHALSSPRVIMPPAMLVTEDTPKPIVINVARAESAQLRVRVDLSGGSLSYPSNQGVVIGGDGRGATFIRGPKKEVIEMLKSSQYNPAKDSNRPETIKVTVYDGQKSSSDTTKIRIRAVNDAPRIEFKQNAFLNLPLGISVSDPDSKKIMVSITTQNGAVRINHPSAKNAGARSTLEGTPEEVNRAISAPGGIVLRPADGKDFSIKIAASDRLANTIRTINVTQKESAVAHAKKQVESRLAGKDPATAKPIFSTANHSNARYERNRNSWVADLDTTPISPWNSHGGNFMAGTLVSPRHIVYATHYAMPVGTKIRFVAKDNSVVERTITNAIRPQYTGMYFPDITVAVLDSDVPESIGFAKILPDDWGKYIAERPNMPCLALDQEEKALVTNLVYLNDYAAFHTPDSQPANSFFESIVTGDSGNPAFMVIDNQLVLLTVWTFGGGGSGTSLAHQKAQINQMMTQLGGSYQLKEVDLSRFGRI